MRSHAAVLPAVDHGEGAQVMTASDRAFGAPAQDAGPRVIAGCDGGSHMADELGPAGPLGPYGPLGMLGPVGKNAWNPSEVISGSDWSQYSNTLTNQGGPLSKAGPLGPDGPVAKADQFPEALRPGGDRAVLGPLGPLGALGPLGPLGPTGAHGYEQDADGNYTHNGEVVRSVNTPTGRHDLVEDYSESRAKSMKDNDTSFMAHGSIEKGRDESDYYAFTAKGNEYVTVSVVSEKQADTFNLTILDDTGNEVAVCKGGSSVPWVQMQVPKGTHLHAAVELNGSVDPLTPTYRLIVTGADQH